MESERARQLDPLSLIIAVDDAVGLYLARQYDPAIEEFRFVLDTDPAFPRANMIVDAYIQKREFQKALAQIEVWHGTEDSPWPWAKEAYVYGSIGNFARAQHAIQKLKKTATRLHMDPAPMLTVAYIGIGDKGRAVSCLQKLYEARSALTALQVDPIFDPLRNEPRFQALSDRVGLSR